jgi:hypothetical protein
MMVYGEHFAEKVFLTDKLSILNFVGGSFVLLISAMVFGPIYLLGSHLWGVIEDGERQALWNILGKFYRRRPPALVEDILPNPHNPI